QRPGHGGRGQLDLAHDRRLLLHRGDRPRRADGSVLTVALIVLAADKGAPGVTTAATALGAVWPRPVLLAECDPAGGDLAYRLPAADGGVLIPTTGLLSLGAVARRGLQPHQIHEHTQK